MFVKAVSDTTGKNFGNIKIAFDISCVIIAIVLSLLFFDLKIVGTREGTIIAAVFTGMVVKFCTKRLQIPITNFLVKKSSKHRNAGIEV